MKVFLVIQLNFKSISRKYLSINLHRKDQVVALYLIRYIRLNRKLKYY